MWRARLEPVGSDLSLEIQNETARNPKGRNVNFFDSGAPELDARRRAQRDIDRASIPRSLSAARTAIATSRRTAELKKFTFMTS